MSNSTNIGCYEVYPYTCPWDTFEKAEEHCIELPVLRLRYGWDDDGFVCLEDSRHVDLGCQVMLIPRNGFLNALTLIYAVVVLVKSIKLWRSEVKRKCDGERNSTHTTRHRIKVGPTVISFSMMVVLGVHHLLNSDPSDLMRCYMGKGLSLAFLWSWLLVAVIHGAITLTHDAQRRVSTTSLLGMHSTLTLALILQSGKEPGSGYYVALAPSLVPVYFSITTLLGAFTILLYKIMRHFREETGSAPVSSVLTVIHGMMFLLMMTLTLYYMVATLVVDLLDLAQVLLVATSCDALVFVLELIPSKGLTHDVADGFVSIELA
jgi:hypothetical protein